MNRIGLICAVVVAAALSVAGAARAAPPPAPKLVVAISVDQLGLNLFEQYRPTFTGGLKRLSNGIEFTGYHAHGATETCPGHSTLLTGMHPAHTGIVANSWYDRASAMEVYCVSVPGVADPTARGPAWLKTDTLGDWLNRARPSARVIAIAGKDRAAIMMAGHHPDRVYWWRDDVGFSTSSHAGPATSSVLAPAREFSARRFAAWRRNPPELWPGKIPPRCAAVQKSFKFGDAQRSGSAPPAEAHNGQIEWRAPSFADQLEVSPTLDQLTLAFASDLVRQLRLGRGRDQDLLAIGLSGTDLIGHRYGPGGAEMCVQLAALDAALGGFLADLDRLKVPYVVMMTADHGAIDAAERRVPPARRVNTRPIVSDLGQHLRTTFGLDYSPLQGGGKQLVLALRPADEPRRAEMTAAALGWLRLRPEVAQAYAVADLAKVHVPHGKAPAELTFEERMALSVYPDRSADILVNYVEGASVGWPRKPDDSVAGHGSAWDYDRRVPILFWWPGIAHRRPDQPIETVDIAPTLAPLLRLTAPPVDGRCIEIGQGCPAPPTASPAAP